MQSGFIWIFAVLFIIVVGIAALILLVWALARRKNARNQVGAGAVSGVGNPGFCASCGRPLQPGNRFCTNCGAPVQTAPPAQPGVSQMPAQPQPDRQGPAGQQPPPFQPFPQRKKSGAGKIVGIVLAVVAAAALLAALLFAVVLPRLRGESGASVASVAESTPRPTQAPAETASPAAPTQHYENREARFALDYPGGSLLNEPNSNNVQILDSGEAHWQVAVEYAWHTVGGSAIYDAEDFTRQIGADPQVLYEWLGADGAELAGPEQVEIAGTTGTQYGVRLNLNGQPHTGSLVVFDGDSDFGCYTFMSLYEEGPDDAAYEEAVEGIRESLTLTGAYTYEGYSLYENEEGGWRFLLRDGAVDGEIELEEDEMTLYPIDGVYSQCSIWLSSSVFSPEDDTVEEALQANCDYYFKYHDNAAYTSQISQVQYGRYPCWEVDLEFDGNMKLAQFLLEVDGAYWDLSMKASEEYYEAAKAVASDVIMSLRFDKGAAAPKATPKPTPRPAATPAPQTSVYGDQEWYLYLDDFKVVIIRMPSGWTEDRVTATDVSNQGNIIAGLRFSSSANADYGGHLVTVAVCEPGALSDLPSGGKLFDLILDDGSRYDVVWIGPTDVQYDYSNDARKDEYQALYAGVQTLLDGLGFYQGS